MSDGKLENLRQSHTLHPHPDQVRDPLFTTGSAFFDPRDLVQVKYELLRRVRVDGESVSHAAALFALSRPTFYAAQAAWERAGLIGLLPELTGPRHAHKLTEDILALLRPRAATMSSTELAAWLREAHQVIVHPRSIERALARAAKKGGSRGKLAQCSDKNERGWPLCPKIHPNFSWMKVRTDFQSLTFCRRAGYFSRESCNTGFHLLLSSVRFGSG